MSPCTRRCTRTSARTRFGSGKVNAYFDAIQVDHEAHLQVATKPFRRDLIKKAQATFEGAIVVQESIKEMEEELEAGNDEEKKQEKAAHLEALRTKEKHRLKGTIRFAGWIFYVERLIITRSLQIYW